MEIETAESSREQKREGERRTAGRMYFFIGLVVILAVALAFLIGQENEPPSPEKNPQNLEAPN